MFNKNLIFRVRIKNINVDLIKTNQRQVIQSSLVLRASVNNYQGNSVTFEYQNEEQNASISLQPYDDENFPTFMVNLTGLAGSKSYNVRTFYMRPSGLYYLDRNETGTIIEGDFYATQKWVNTQISGAIATSY